MTTTRYDDTQAGRASEWVRAYVPGQQADMCAPQPADFHGAVEALGIEKARRMMREEVKG